jgi:hypothetical protein
LRGLYIQRLFGSQRALKTVEDFTEFEQRAADFDGDSVIATKKGVNILDRGGPDGTASDPDGPSGAFAEGTPTLIRLLRCGVGEFLRVVPRRRE